VHFGRKALGTAAGTVRSGARAARRWPLGQAFTDRRPPPGADLPPDAALQSPTHSELLPQSRICGAEMRL